ncbi:hypothetical protein FH972_024857 [Carpinus fangiana]|uniref:WHIM1 domain-containing protein n=1 Tax=Carpinus fangiana TaxID=176857 RepID=A0A5N6KZB6_9ROSI|nr:hypothetical protein FH972_024857 [Carpinus fangiana]
MSDSDSPLSSPPLTDDEEKPPKMLQVVNGKLSFLPTRKAPTKPAKPMMRVRAPSSSPEVESDKPGNEPSPPHEYVLADNPDIAFITMFRNRFADSFPKSVSNIGPQDIERGVVDSRPSEQMENLLCALLGLALNRVKPVEYGLPNGAPASICPSGVAPRTDTHPPLDLVLLRTLTHWALAGSEVINATIKEAYKQSRKNDDINQPLSVQPWGLDGRKRRYWLIEGHNDTPFRIYLESSRKRKKNTWWSVSGTIDEALELAQQLEHGDRAQSAQRLASGIRSAVPRLEETERKRQRKQYRLDRRAAFSRPEPGMSMYEGRTRGNRVRYNYDDDDMYGSEDTNNRRSARQSGTPAEDGPTYTASGRQVRSRFGRTYGNDGGPTDSSKATSPVRDFDSDDDDEPVTAGHGGRRSGRGAGPSTSESRARTGGLRGSLNSDEDEDMDDELSENAWEGDDNDIMGKQDADDDEADDDMSDLGSVITVANSNNDDEDSKNSSMVVTLKYGSKEKSSPLIAPVQPTKVDVIEGAAKEKAEVSMLDIDELGSSQQENKEPVVPGVIDGVGIVRPAFEHAATNGWH